MKKLMKLSLYLLSFTFLLVSCENSTKGDWSASDMVDCKKDVVKEFEEPDAKAVLTMFNTDIDDFVPCICEKLEEEYDSYKVADKAMSDMTEEEAGKFMLSSDCLSVPMESDL
jgi:hypothetical protein